MGVERRLHRPRKFFESMTLFSDWDSRLAWIGLLTRRPRRGFAAAFPADSVALRLRALGGTRVYCRPGTSDATVLYDAFYRRYHLPPPEIGAPRTILDLGSNIGLTVAHYAALYPAARIVAVELDEENARACGRNLAPWGDRCSLVRGAAWSENGEVAYAGPSTQARRIDPAGLLRSPAYDMPTLLDMVGGSVVDFVKMDIEGAEQELFRRPQAWIGRVRCLKVEVHAPYSVAACIGDLERFGFRCERDTAHPAAVVAFGNNRDQETRDGEGCGEITDNNGGPAEAARP